MKTILRLFTITCLAIASAASAGKAPDHPRKAPDHPPQAEPVAKMLQAVTSGNHGPLKSVFSASQLRELDPKDDWEDLLKVLQKQVGEFYGTTKLNLKAFQYEYIGNDKSGQVVFTYKGTLKDSMDVVKEGSRWKVSGPTKGFN